MKYAALATDYDGTLAHDGIVDGPTIASLDRARAAGLRLIMVTGRELDDLFATFAHCELFELIVAENGALLYSPATGASRSVADAPPPRLIERMQHEGVPLSVGKTIIATVEPHDVALANVIREMGLPWHIIFNKGSVMALPQNVNKASGFKAALQQLNLEASQLVGVGDAENDMSFLAVCGLSVAVANALPSVKAAAHRVMAGARGAGVAELIDDLIGSASVEHQTIAQPVASIVPGIAP